MLTSNASERRRSRAGLNAVHTHLTTLVFWCLAPSQARAAVVHIDPAPRPCLLGISHVPQRRVGSGFASGLRVAGEKVDEDALGLHFHGHAASVNLAKPRPDLFETGRFRRDRKPLRAPQLRERT